MLKFYQSSIFLYISLKYLDRYLHSFFSFAIVFFFFLFCLFFSSQLNKVLFRIEYDVFRIYFITKSRALLGS